MTKVPQSSLIREVLSAVPGSLVLAVLSYLLLIAVLLIGGGR